jgi:topoisomerase-4 subunit A
LLNNVMDESAEKIRIVLEPKSRNVDPVLLMETLYKRTDLETRLNLNLNVLDKNGAPNVMSLREILAAFLEHRFEVLVRRSEFRLSKINHRLELLEGLLIAFLNLDEIIRIIREEDEPKAIMMQKFKLTDLQAEAILNTRLRALRKLEEQKIRGEHADLSEEKSDLEALLGSEDKQRDAIAGEIREIRKEVGVKTELGKRLTDFAEAPDVGDISEVDVLPKEPITVLCSKQGWIRAIKGHVDLSQEHKHKEGDQGRFAFHALTSDQILIFSTEGKFFTLIGDKLQRGKGFGEPVRMLFGLGDGEDILSIHIYKPELEFIVASSDARGFRVDAKDVTAQTKNGRQVLNVDKNASAKACVPVEGDTVAIIGENRKLIIFGVSALPKMTRGKGVRLQKYKGGSLSDITTLNLADGLSWQTGSRTRTEKDLQPWCAHRGTTGRMAPMGFPRDHKFQKLMKD